MSSADKDGWLNRKKYIYNSSAYYSKSWTRNVDSKNDRVVNHLHSYTMGDVVTCIESIRMSQQQDIIRYNKPDNMLHLVFVGDSRSRQQFYNFLKVR